MGEGWGEGIPQIATIFPNTLTAQNTSLAACCPLSNSLPRGERTGWLLGLKVLQGKQVVRAAFCFSDDLKSTAVNPSCFSNQLKPQNLLQPAPSPVGEGWGEGIPRISATFPNTLTAQNTSLAACCPLSNSLPQGERTGYLLELRVMQGKQVVLAVFYFSDDLYKCSIQAACTL